MCNRIRPGRARTLVRLVFRIVAWVLRAVSARAARSVVPRPVVGGTIARPPHVHGYGLSHEQRSRRTALVLALDGVDVGPRATHGHRVGKPVAVRAEAAA
ncbi:hypothetical protein SRIMHP_18375 [Streptomyces rimosus subsp. rimosus]|uniref:Secreted protein n=1 Tax=Streptomyces rimosus subsp. rimosus TaxID=132474 RepID=A0ABY3Z3B8_STRRM|nr:hypothetical protein SRIMR7_20895 [Streptomyces rimosus subsp. rimosus]UTH96099.1 hypothetical protein SRIMHP_18375 [Streptomyces rimosus subsp. rimosus]UTJ14196.1 hypothetical protein SRIMDV3_18270 [Streptomyces rimosus subsp. rimosus]